MHKYISIITPILWALFYSAVTPADEYTLADRYFALALQGDLSGAEALFRHSDSDAQVADLARQYRSRFIVQDEELSPGTGAPLVDDVVSIYRRYWVKTLTGELNPQEGLDFLSGELGRVLDRHSSEYAAGSSGEHPDDPQKINLDVYTRLGVVLQERGFHFLAAPAPPLQDLFLWKKETRKSYRIRLTDRTQPVKVTFMSGFHSLGWKHFATLGRVATTGWVEGSRLYCVCEAYDLNSEEFRVSYLKHESRHLADFEQFPGLPSAELEYRAKLTELAFASESARGLLDDFYYKSARNPDSPHALANDLVSRDMYQAMYGAALPESGSPWHDADLAAVNGAARDLLRQNTEMLETERH